MKEENVTKKDKTIFEVYYTGTVLGLLFLLFGILQLIVSIGSISSLQSSLYIPNDIIGSFILILTGIIFLYGIFELNKGIREGVAFVYVGIIFSLFFLGIYLLSMLLNGIQAYLLMNSDFEGWSPLDDLRPGIYLGLISIIVLIKWREKISIKKIKS
jgi:hypothetical protein